MLLATLFFSGQLPALAVPENERPPVDETDGGGSKVSRAFVRQEIETLDKHSRLYLKTHDCFIRLLNEGYDPTLLDECLNALGDDAMVVGMPADLVLAYFGEPLSRDSTTFGERAAEVWRIRVKPDRIEKAVVADGRVVQISGDNPPSDK